jgi:hypothetical protein
VAERVQRLDPRWIWAIVMAIVWASVLAPLNLPVPVTPGTRQAYEWIQSLPPGSVLFIAPEYNPGTYPELNPQVRAVAIEAFRHGLKLVIGASGFTLGAQLAEDAVEQAAKVVGGKQYGVDWVNVGYKPGGQATENELVQDFQKATQGVDFYGKPLSGYPLTKDIKNLNDKYFSGIWVEDTGSPGCPDWYANAAIPGHLPLGCGVITMSVPQYQTYLTAGQFKGLLGGARGAGELEELIKSPWLGLASQETHAAAAALIVILVVLGNVLARRRPAKGGQAA